ATSAVRAAGVRGGHRLAQIITKLGKRYPLDARAQQTRASRCVIRRRTCFYEQQTLVLVVFGIARRGAGGISECARGHGVIGCRVRWATDPSFPACLDKIRTKRVEF